MINRISDNDVVLVLKRVKAGDNPRKVARDFGVSLAVVQNLVYRARKSGIDMPRQKRQIHDWDLIIEKLK